MDRRTLLKFLALNAVTLPYALRADTALLAPALSLENAGSTAQKRLILIELKGGNDGLNTLIPYNDPAYYRLRPKLAIRKQEVLALDEHMGLHPSMSGLKGLFENKELAIIQGVGYPNPNRSHFRSIEIWDTASKSDEYLDTGWLTTLPLSQQSQLKAVILGGDNGPLSGMEHGAISIRNIQRFLNQSRQIKSQIYVTGNNPEYKHILLTEAEIRKSADVLRRYISRGKTPAYSYPKNAFGRQLGLATQLIAHGADITLFKLSLSGFDTHLNQSKPHARLLGELSKGIDTLRKNLIASGDWDNTLVMTYSEFGRRAAENASRGTDHGVAAPHFVAGGKVNGGLYGTAPSLDHLDKNGDLVHTTDFRSYYHTISKKFLGIDSPLLMPFETLDFL